MASRGNTGSDRTFVLCDLDHFQGVNDAGDHDVGNQVMRAESVAMRMELRDGDAIAQSGGDALLLVLPGPIRSMPKAWPNA